MGQFSSNEIFFQKYCRKLTFPRIPKIPDPQIQALSFLYIQITNVKKNTLDSKNDLWKLD